MTNGALLVVMAIGAVIYMRSNLVLKMRLRRIDEIGKSVRRDIRTISSTELNRRYDALRNIGFYAMVFDITKWTYKQFFPNPVE